MDLGLNLKLNWKEVFETEVERKLDVKTNSFQHYAKNVIESNLGIF